jgi:hypothetical protein
LAITSSAARFSFSWILQYKLLIELLQFASPVYGLFFISRPFGLAFCRCLGGGAQLVNNRIGTLQRMRVGSRRIRSVCPG